MDAMKRDDCIYPDCQIKGEWLGTACEHSCPFEQEQRTGMDTRETKLPQWAQNSMREFRNRIAEIERELAIAKKAAPKTGATGKVIADCLGGDGFPLDDRALIEFHLPNGKVSVMLRDHGTRLDLNATMGTLCIHPLAANCAQVTVVR